MVSYPRLNRSFFSLSTFTIKTKSRIIYLTIHMHTYRIH